MERTETGLPETNPELSGSFIPTHVILHERWSGGSAGLVNIKRMNYSLKVLAISEPQLTSVAGLSDDRAPSEAEAP